MKSIFTYSLLILISFAFNQQSFAQCVTSESNVYAFSYGGSNFEIVKENLNWVDASSCAVVRGGYLAEIDSQAEQDAIFNNVNLAGITGSNTVAPDGGGASYLWIGGNDLAIEGRWVWDGDNTGVTTQFWQGTSTGSPIGGLYNNWGNEPDDYNGQDALGFAFTDWPLGVAGQWNDVDETNTLYYIIEYPDVTGLNEGDINPTIEVYPNPSSELVIIDFPENYIQFEETSIEIYNLNGQMIKQIQSIEGKLEISTDELNNGIYFIKVLIQNKETESYKIVISK